MRATAVRIDRIVREVQPDILQPHSPVLNALPALWVGRRRRLPVVYEIGHPGRMLRLTMEPPAKAAFATASRARSRPSPSATPTR